MKGREQYSWNPGELRRLAPNRVRHPTYQVGDMSPVLLPCRKDDAGLLAIVAASSFCRAVSSASAVGFWIKGGRVRPLTVAACGGQRVGARPATGSQADLKPWHPICVTR